MEKNSKKTVWTKELLIETFDLTRIYENMPLLNDWLSTDEAITDQERLLLEELRLRLLKNVEDWNEEELKMKFIAFLLNMIKYETGEIRTYFEKELSAKIGDYSLKTVADFLVAKGFGSRIKTPYFCFHEYKRERKYEPEPLGQLLCALLIA